MRNDGIAVGDRSYRGPEVAVGDRSYTALVLGMLAAVMLWAGPVHAELLARWSMDEIKDGIVADVSGHGHDAVAQGLEGRLPQVVEAITPRGLRFTGKDEQFLEVKNVEGLTAPAAFTVMAWIKPMARGGTYEIIGNKGDRSGNPPWPGWRLRYFWTRVALDYGSADGSETRLYAPEWSVPAGLWSHVAATYDGKTVAIYVDCEQVSEVAVTQPILPTTRPMIIGNYIGRKNAYAFDGGMDELRVYGSVLTAEEIFAAATDGMP